AEQKSSLFARERELARELFASPRRVCPTADTANSSVGRSVIENHSQLLYIRLMVSREITVGRSIRTAGRRWQNLLSLTIWWCKWRPSSLPRPLAPSQRWYRSSQTWKYHWAYHRYSQSDSGGCRAFVINEERRNLCWRRDE